VAPSTHQSLDARLDTLMSHKRRNILSVGGDVPIGSEVLAVTSSISKPVGLVSWTHALGGVGVGFACCACS
jgi:hypothetical protein